MCVVHTKLFPSNFDVTSSNVARTSHELRTNFALTSANVDVTSTLDHPTSQSIKYIRHRRVHRRPRPHLAVKVQHLSLYSLERFFKGFE